MSQLSLVLLSSFGNVSASHCPKENVFVMPAPKLLRHRLTEPNLSQGQPCQAGSVSREAGPLVNI